MRFRELHIETLREAPARASREGVALLMRAGYLAPNGQSTDLGSRLISRLKDLSQTTDEFFSQLGLHALRTAQGEVVFESLSGSDRILHCTACGYADLLEQAKCRKRRPPHESLAPVEKIATPNCTTIESLASFLGISREKTAKALMYTRLSDGQFVFVVLPGDMQISEGKLRRLVGDVQPASQQEIMRAGAVPGYASPIGLEGALIVVDDLIPESRNLVAGANEAGYHLANTNSGRDYEPDLVADITLAGSGEACWNCGEPLRVVQGDVLADESGYRYEGIVEALAELHHDGRGLCLPWSAAPFLVYLMDVPSKEVDTHAASEELYRELDAAGVPVLYDDRAERAGVKFTDADLIGCPLRLTVGEKSLKSGMVELKDRHTAEVRFVSAHDVLGAVHPPSNVQS